MKKKLSWIKNILLSQVEYNLINTLQMYFFIRKFC